MNRDEMFATINKGVPNYVKVELDTGIMIRECASDRAKLITEIQEIKSSFEQEMIKTMGFDKYRGYFFRDLRILTSYKTAESTLHISPLSFLTRLKNILGVDNDSLDFNDLELKNQLLERLEVLRKMKTPSELQNEFPLIYKDYLTSRITYDQMKKIGANPAYSNHMNYQWHMYNSFGFDTRLSSFIEKQYEMYRSFIVRRQFVEGYCNRTPLDLSKFTGLDKEKFEFYVAHRYLETAKEAKDFQTIQNCVYYLMTYFRESKNYDISIKIYNGKKITYRKLLNDFKKLLGNFKGLKPIDEDRSKFEGYHIKHVINHLNKYYGNMVNWYIIPDSPIFSTSLGQTTVIGRERNALSKEEKDRRIMKRMGLYNQKVDLYENSGYVLKIFGWNEFNGYICYIYPNGKIIMDKLFEDYIRCTPAREEAIYSIDALDFDEMSKKNKQQLMKSEKARRMYHAGDWEGRVKSIIEEAGTEESKEAVRKLELRFKTKKSNS